LALDRISVPHASPDRLAQARHQRSSAGFAGVGRRSGDSRLRSYFFVQFADDEEPEPAALAFFASRFSFSDLLAAVFEVFEPPLSLLAMVTSFQKERRGADRITLDPPTDLLDGEGRTERDAVAGQMEAGPSSAGRLCRS
jgi:hypothetical protein